VSTETIEGRIRRKLVTLYSAPTTESFSALLMRWKRDNPAAFRDDRWWERDYTFVSVNELP